MFSFVFFGSYDYQFGCTVASASAQRPVEHVKNYLQNITTEWTPHSVQSSLLTLEGREFRQSVRVNFQAKRGRWTIASDGEQRREARGASRDAPGTPLAARVRRTLRADRLGRRLLRRREERLWQRHRLYQVARAQQAVRGEVPAAVDLKMSDIAMWSSKRKSLVSLFRPHMQA